MLSGLALKLLGGEGRCCNKSIGRSKSLFDNEGRFSPKVLPPRIRRGSICVSGKEMDIDCCGQNRPRVQLIQRNQRLWFRQLNGLTSRTSVAHRFCTYGRAGSDLSYSIRKATAISLVATTECCARVSSWFAVGPRRRHAEQDNSRWIGRHMLDYKRYRCTASESVFTPPIGDAPASATASLRAQTTRRTSGPRNHAPLGNGADFCIDLSSSSHVM